MREILGGKKHTIKSLRSTFFEFFRFNGLLIAITARKSKIKFFVREGKNVNPGDFTVTLILGMNLFLEHVSLFLFLEIRKVFDILNLIKK